MRFNEGTEEPRNELILGERRGSNDVVCDEGVERVEACVVRKDGGDEGVGVFCVEELEELKCDCRESIVFLSD